MDVFLSADVFFVVKSYLAKLLDIFSYGDCDILVTVIDAVMCEFRNWSRDSRIFL